MLLDQEGFECDPISRVEGDTPLHSAVRYLNSLDFPPTPEILSFSADLISMMIEAGSDPRLRNKAHLTPYQLVDPRNTKLRQQLQDAVDISHDTRDFVVDDEEDVGDDYAGSGSDSDFDPEEFKREKARREQERKMLSNGVGAS